MLLVHLPHGHDPASVATGMTAAAGGLPSALRRSLTWDQGNEMSYHAQISLATDLDIYFCDPHSPWERGSNENTNWVLCQYFPEGTPNASTGIRSPGLCSEVPPPPRPRLALRIIS